MVKFLKSLFSKPAPLDFTPTPKKKPGLSLAAFDRVMEQMTPTSAVARYEPPKLPHGVRPDKPPVGDALILAIDSNGITEREMAMDDAGGATFGPTYSFLNSSPLGCGLTFPGFPFLASLQQISEYRAPCEVLSTEMTREWVEFVSKGETEDDKSEKIKDITDRFEDLKIREAFQKCALFDLQYGGGHLYWVFKGQDSDKIRQMPLVVAEIKMGTLERVTPIEPYWMSPYSYNADKPDAPDFYVPQSWYMLGKKTHTTRLMVFIGRALPDLLKPSYNFTGISLAQLMAPYIDRWLRTAKSVNDLINIFSIVNLSTNMQSTLAEGGDNGQTLVQRMRLFTASRDNKGIMLTNKDSEELQIMNASLGSIDKLQAQSQEHMAAPSHIPLIKLFGITPTGLNATSEGEFQAFYDWVAAQQAHIFGDHLKRALEIVQMDLYGVVDPDITFKFKSLFKPTVKEQAEIRKADGDRDAAYVTMGAISPDEVRARLAGDPNSGYDGLTGDAPGPPIDPNQIDPETGEPHAPPVDPNQEASQEHASSEADKDRKHGAAQSDKDRKAAAKKPPAKK